MDAGKLRSRILLQRPKTGQRPSGQPAAGWDDVATISADIRYQHGIEAIRAATPTMIARASIRIRRRTDVTSAWRAVLRPGTPDETVFEVQAVMPSESGDTYADLACEVVR